MMAVGGGGKLKVGIVGATGAVGEEIVKVLGNRQFPVSELHLYASARSAGKSVATPFGSVTIEEFELGKARGLDVIFLAVGGDFSLEYAHKLSEGDGPVVIDNSSAFRMDPTVPLVVPEINQKTAKGKKLIANPNCTTAIGLMALFPLHVAYGIKKVIMSTYQAASGAGAEGVWVWEGGRVEGLCVRVILVLFFLSSLAAARRDREKRRYVLDLSPSQLSLNYFMRALLSRFHECFCGWYK
jgi:aspartate-semialdehyde dehydrogenase